MMPVPSNLPLQINQDDMPTVEKSAHLGILRSKSNQKTGNSQIEQNYLISNIASIA
jgi:hypothetical protein